MRGYLTFLSYCHLWLLASIAMPLMASAEAPSTLLEHRIAVAFPAGSAHQLIATTTDDLVTLIRQSKDYIADDEARFYRELDDLLRPLIDFHFFARAVMGRHANEKKMVSLTVVDRMQLEQQIDRFSEVFSTALIHTYGRGLLAFEGQAIEVLPSAGNDHAATRAQVKQLIHGDRSSPYEIYYSLRKDQQGQWRLRNLIVESINLGKVYRNQFDNAYYVYHGDIDQVIDNWSSTSAGSGSSASE